MTSDTLELVARAIGPAKLKQPLDWSRLLVTRNTAPLFNGGRPDGDYMWNRGCDLFVMDEHGRRTHFCKIRPANNSRIVRATRFREILSADPELRDMMPITTGATDGTLMVQASEFVEGVSCGRVLAGLDRDRWAIAMREVLDTSVKLLTRATQVLPELQRLPESINLLANAEADLALLGPEMDPAHAAALRRALEAGGSVTPRVQHGDFWPGNILHTDHGWVVLDYESLGEVLLPLYDTHHMLRSALSARLGWAAPPRWIDAFAGPTKEAEICRRLLRRRADALRLSRDQRTALMVAYLLDITARLRRRRVYLMHSQPFFDDIVALAADLAEGGEKVNTIVGATAETVPAAATDAAPVPVLPVEESLGVDADVGSAPLQRVGSHGVVYAAGILLSKLIAFLMLPVYTRYLTTADYGTLQLIELTFEIVSIVAGSRLATGIYHFYHKAATEVERRAVLFTSFATMVASFLVATGAAWLAAPSIAQLVFDSQENTGLIRIAAAGLAFQGLFSVPMAYLQLRERSRQVVAINAVKLLTQLSLNIVFVVALQMGARGMLISALIGNAVFGTWLAAYFLKDAGFAWSAKALRQTLAFGLPFVATQIGTFVSTYGDRYFLQRAADENEVGVYGLAYQFGFLLATIGYFPFASIWDPIRFETAKRPDREVIYSKALIYFSTVFLTLAVVIALTIVDFLRIMTTQPFWPAAQFVPVILLAYLFQSWTDFLNIGVMIKEKTHLITVANWVAAGVAILFYALLIPPYHGMGAAVATAIAFFVRLVMVYTFSQRLWPIGYNWGPVLRLFSLAVGIVILNAFVPHLPLVWSLLARAALFMLYVAGVRMLRILSEDEMRRVVALVRHPARTIGDLRRLLTGAQA